MRRQRGVTLIELVISLVIIGVGRASIILAFGTAGVAAARPDRTVQAVAIAEAYLEEISLQPFVDPDGVTEGSRDLFDDIFDYHGLSESPPRDQDDVPLPGLQFRHVHVAKPDRSGTHRSQAGNRFEHRRLATAGRTQQRPELPFGNSEARLRDRGRFAKPFGHLVQSQSAHGTQCSFSEENEVGT